VDRAWRERGEKINFKRLRLSGPHFGEAAEKSSWAAEKAEKTEME